MPLRLRNRARICLHDMICTVPWRYSAHKQRPFSDFSVFIDFSEFCMAGFDESQSDVD